MAADEFLFRSLNETPQTFVRFYRWIRPTASLGYGQTAARVVDLEFCRQNGVDVVRRPTGGKLVLHYREITYAVASSDTQAFTSTLGGSYKLISEGLLKGLQNMGLRPTLAGETPKSYIKAVQPCFSQPAQNEIEIDGRKIIGSAQKRIGDRFLQHGSIPLEGDDGLLKPVSRWTESSPRLKMTSLSEALGRPVGYEETAAQLASGLAGQWGIVFEKHAFSPEDRAAIEDLRRKKYATDAWTLEGKDG
jgi:lipoate-protein ligase A